MESIWNYMKTRFLMDFLKVDHANMRVWSPGAAGFDGLFRWLVWPRFYGSFENLGGSLNFRPNRNNPEKC